MQREEQRHRTRYAYAWMDLVKLSWVDGAAAFVEAGFLFAGRFCVLEDAKAGLLRQVSGQCLVC